MMFQDAIGIGHLVLRVMACHLIGTMPYSEPVQSY